LKSLVVVRDYFAEKFQVSQNLVYEAAFKADNAEPDPTLTAMAKLSAGKAGVRVAEEVVQIHGGYEYSKNIRLNASIGMQRSVKYMRKPRR
jgi:alkylation response protein AidB-like acyl-CoA dehydrogenase